MLSIKKNLLFKTLDNKTKLKEEDSEFHLTNAQNLRSDQESLIFQIDKEKRFLNNTKKKENYRTAKHENK